jgi:uncharacterized protein YvpB
MPTELVRGLKANGSSPTHWEIKKASANASCSYGSGHHGEPAAIATASPILLYRYLLT